jgi:hypothetical protein
MRFRCDGRKELETKANHLLAGLLVAGSLLGGPLETAAPDAPGPPTRDFTCPIEIDFDTGAANGNATIMRLMPLAAFPMGERWKIINLTLAIVADAPGGANLGSFEAA